MTDRKHCKARVRARMARTGERYATAHAHVTRGPGTAAPAAPGPDGADDVSPTTPGLDAATTALVGLLTAAGTKVTPATALIIGGGIGMGVFQFRYEAEGFASFFLAGRHRWDDDRAYLVDALARLGIAARVTETSGPKLAARQLGDALADGGPVVAWVDAATLGTRAYPARFDGGMYHVVLVDAIDPDGRVTIRDLAEGPLQVDGERFLAARGRIAKDRHRLLWLAPDQAPPGPGALETAIGLGLAATVRGLREPRTRPFGLDALLDWRDRLRGDGRDAWSRVFPPGGLLLDALTAIVSGVTTYGTDGTLHRRSFAAGLREAATRTGTPALMAVADRYDDLASHWAALASAALPGDVREFRTAIRLLETRHARYRREGAGGAQVLAETWSESDALRAAVDAAWPLDAAATRRLLDDLAARLEVIHGQEVAALDALDEVRPRTT